MNFEGFVITALVVILLGIGSILYNLTTLRKIVSPKPPPQNYRDIPTQ